VGGYHPFSALLVVNNETLCFQPCYLIGDAQWLFGVNIHIVRKKRPALVRWSSGSVADSVGANMHILFESTKDFWKNLLIECCYCFFVLYIPDFDAMDMGNSSQAYAMML